VKELQAELLALAKEQAEMDILRREERADYAQAKTDLEAGLAGVRQALGVLREYYGSSPAAMIQDGANLMSAMQIAHNPFGDYAPQSTQIQGILRGMYEAFARDLESDNVAEATAQKAHEELLATKLQELNTLQATLGIQQKDNADKTLERDEANQRLDETKAQLIADEEFFATTKAGCQEKAQQWAVRSRLRTEELTGVKTAVNILTSDQAQKVFLNSTTTFVQISAVTETSDAARRSGVSGKLARMAQQFHSLGLANLAVDVRAGWHFDKVIASIDNMIAVIRQEEQDDIAHRDRCQRAEDKNSYETEDLGNAITKAGSDITRLEGEARDLQTKIDQLDIDIGTTETSMEQLLDMRNTAVAEFRQALKDDVEAVALLDQTLVALARFYTTNKIPMSLAQKKGPSGPEYTVDADKAPETSWADEKYGGRSEETHGIVEILKMIKEDVEKEIKTSREDDAAAEAQYEKERGDLQDTLDAQRALKASTEREKSEVEARKLERTKFKNAKNKDLTAEGELATSIYNDCSWVATHFQSRRTKREKEIEGLIDAKGYLGGAEDGSMIFEDCAAAVPFCEPCFPFSRCGGDGGAPVAVDESATFVEGENCGPELALCADAGPCFDNTIGCAEDGTMAIEECEAALPFCAPCFPLSRCGSAGGEEVVEETPEETPTPPAPPVETPVESGARHSLVSGMFSIVVAGLSWLWMVVISACVSCVWRFRTRNSICWP